eukprot:403361440
MNNMLSLKLSDKVQRHQFILDIRYRQIIIISLLILAIRVLNLLGIIIANVINQRDFKTANWVIIGVFLGYHVLLILLNIKFKYYFSYFHGPLLILSFILNCVSNYIQPLSDVNIIGNAVNYSFFLFCGLLLNTQWILTTISIIINLICALVYLVLYYKIADAGILTQYFFTTALIVFAVYHQERLMKENFVSLRYNERLNQDLKNLLLNFPKPILLLDQEKKEVVLANKQLYRLLSIEEGQDLKSIQERISQRFLEPYNYIEGLGDSDQDQDNELHNCHQENTLNNSESELNEQKFNLYETIKNQEPNFTCYCIKTTTNFENDIPYQNQSNINDENENDKLIGKINEYQNMILEGDKLLNLSIDYQCQQNSPQKFSEIVNIKQQNMHFQKKDLQLILFHRITGFVKYEKLQMENNFYEMITATVSHDMRTPINAITGLIDALNQLTKDAEQKKIIKVIKNSSKILSFLVNDILDFFQLKNGKFKSRLYKTDVKAAVQEILDMFELVSFEKKIEMRAEFTDNIPTPLFIDKQRMQQVLINLLSNSLKFTIQGHITIKVSYDAAEHKIIMKVADTGVGVKSEDQVKLFKLFGKLDQTQSLNTKGIGLGLNICKKVVEACGGKIQLESDYVDGAAFCFSMKAYLQLSQVNILDFEIITDSDINSRKASQQNNKTAEVQEIVFKNKQKQDNPTLYQSFQMSDESFTKRVDFTPYTTRETSSLRSQNVQSSHRFTFLQQLNQQFQQEQHENFQQQDLPMILSPQPPSLRSQSSQTQDSQQQYISRNQQLQNLCPCESRPQILIIDDNVFNIVMLQTLLEMQFNQRVEKATNGLEGIQKIKERQKLNETQPCICDNLNENYKIVFMDCNMPIMDGFEASRAIRKLPGIDQHELVIIALTANANKSFKDKCFQAGMDEFQTKPVTSDQLKSMLIQRGIYEEYE